METITNLIKLKQGNYDLNIFSIKAKDLVNYSKIERSRIGKDDKKNSQGVQRRLNLKRVLNIRKYLLKKDSTIPVNFIVNICTKDHKEKWFEGNAVFKGENLELNDEDLIIIDGQHRLAAFDYDLYNETLNNKGIRFTKLRNNEKKILDEFELIVVGYKDISRIEMATIFISINDNQKKVSKSIIFDLLHIKSKDLVSITPDIEKILLAGVKFEEIKATSIVEQLNDDKYSYWYNTIKVEGGLYGTIELGSFVEHLSLAIKKNRFLNETDFPYHEDRYLILKDFYNILVDSIFEDTYELDGTGNKNIVSKANKFLNKDCFLSKPSGVGIVLHKDFFDTIISKVYFFGGIDKNKLTKILKKLSYKDFYSTQDEYKGHLSSKAGYTQIRSLLLKKLGL